MTDTESLFAGIDHVIGYEIAKDYSRGDAAIVRSYFLYHLEEIGENPQAFVERLVSNDAMPADSIGSLGPGAPSSKPGSNLSIKIEDGNSLYLVRLANASDNLYFDTRAKWGPAGQPIGFLPETIHGGKNPLKQMGLFYRAGSSVKFVPSAAMPARLDDVPDQAWLAFRCDIADMRKFWRDIGYPADKPFIIPFRFNLFDRVTKTPVWNVDHVHPDDDAAGFDHDADVGNKKVSTHGGKHPNFAGKAVMTHGGKHPNDVVGVIGYGYASIIRGRVHGGMHPNSPVEYFYGDALPPTGGGEI